MKVIFKKISESKNNSNLLRFGVFNHQVLLFSISWEIKKKNLIPLISNKNVINLENSIEIDLSSEELDDLQKKEKEFITHSMMTYLAHRETSPRKLYEWLARRSLDRDTIDELIMLAEEKKFLVRGRFIQSKVEQRFRAGKKPWWIVQQEIKHEVILGNEPPEKIEEIVNTIEKFAYNDLEMLKKNSKKNINTSDNSDIARKKLKKKLLYRGFSLTTIENWLKERL